jgi:hypothetical protein
LERFKTGAKTAYIAYNCPRMGLRWVLDATSPMIHAKCCALRWRMVLAMLAI